MKKTVFLVTEYKFNPVSEMLAFEKDIRADEFFRNRDEVCLEISFLKDNDYDGLIKLLSKKSPDFVIFHSASQGCVEKSLNLIKLKSRIKFQTLSLKKEGYNRYPGKTIVRFSEIILKHTETQTV